MQGLSWEEFWNWTAWQPNDIKRELIMEQIGLKFFTGISKTVYAEVMEFAPQDFLQYIETLRSPVPVEDHPNHAIQFTPQRLTRSLSRKT